MDKILPRQFILVATVFPRRFRRFSTVDPSDTLSCDTAGTPDYLYPRTEFTREYGIPIRDSQVNCVWGYCIPVVHFVSSYVSPTDSTTTLRRSSRNVDLCERSRVLGERGGIPMAKLRREGVPDSVATHRREEIDDMRTKNNTLHT